MVKRERKQNGGDFATIAYASAPSLLEAPVEPIAGGRKCKGKKQSGGDFATIAYASAPSLLEAPIAPIVGGRKRNNKKQSGGDFATIAYASAPSLLEAPLPISLITDAPIAGGRKRKTKKQTGGEPATLEYASASSLLEAPTSPIAPIAGGRKRNNKKDKKDKEGGGCGCGLIGGDKQSGGEFFASINEAPVKSGGRKRKDKKNGQKGGDLAETSVGPTPNLDFMTSAMHSQSTPPQIGNFETPAVSGGDLQFMMKGGNKAEKKMSFKQQLSQLRKMIGGLNKL